MTFILFLFFIDEIFSAISFVINVPVFATPFILSSKILFTKSPLVFFTSLLTLLYGASRKPNSLTLAKIASCVTTPIFTLSGLVTGSNFAYCEL